jgi:hypothetical protein
MRNASPPSSPDASTEPAQPGSWCTAALRRQRTITRDRRQNVVAFAIEPPGPSLPSQSRCCILGHTATNLLNARVDPGVTSAINSNQLAILAFPCFFLPNHRCILANGLVAGCAESIQHLPAEPIQSEARRNTQRPAHRNSMEGRSRPVHSMFISCSCAGVPFPHGPLLWFLGRNSRRDWIRTAGIASDG